MNNKDPEDPRRSAGLDGGVFSGNSTELYRSLEELVTQERLIPNRGEASFSLRDIDEDDELYLIDIPRHLNPHDLVGVTLDSDRSKKKFKISQEKYNWVPDEEAEVITCVMATGKEKTPFRAVNVRASGKIVVCKHKTANKGMEEGQDDEDESRIRFPEDLKVRNPLFGEKGGKLKKVKKVKVKEEKED